MKIRTKCEMCGKFPITILCYDAKTYYWLCIECAISFCLQNSYLAGSEVDNYISFIGGQK